MYFLYARIVISHRVVVALRALYRGEKSRNNLANRPGENRRPVKPGIVAKPSMRHRRIGGIAAKLINGRLFNAWRDVSIARHAIIGISRGHLLVMVTPERPAG